MTSTSPLLMVFSQDSTTTTGSKVQGGSSNNNMDASKSSEQPSSKLPRGRKSSKSSSKSPLMNKQNKPTRRGMGVAKLERWLEAEKWSGGGEGDHPNLLPADVATGFIPLQHCHNQLQTPPLIPVATSPPVYVGSADFFMSRHSSSSSSSSSSFMAASSSKVISSTLGGGCKELSSIPKVIQYHHQCDASSYSKNRCMNMDEMQGMILGGMNNNQDKLVFPHSLINCHMLTGLSHGHNNPSLLQTNDFNSMRQIYNQDSEMKGITRCSNSVKEYEFFTAGKGLKEYEFFPGTTSERSYARSTAEQPHHYCYTTEPASASSPYFIIPSSDFSQYNPTTSAAAASTNALDLSLKL